MNPNTPLPVTLETLPAGDWAIVEVLGHRTLVGCVSEVERFGTKLMQIQPLFGDFLLAPVLLGGGSIYQFTPCTAEVAWSRRPRREYELPPSLSATLPQIEADGPPAHLPDFLRIDREDDEY